MNEPFPPLADARWRVRTALTMSVRAQQADDTIVVGHENSLDTQPAGNATSCARAGSGDYS